MEGEPHQPERDLDDLEAILSAVHQQGPGWTRREVILQSIPADERPDRPGNTLGFLKRHGYVDVRQHDHDPRQREYRPTGKEL